MINTPTEQVSTATSRDQLAISQTAMGIVHQMLHPRVRRHLRPKKALNVTPLLCPSSLPQFQTHSINVSDGSQRDVGRCQNIRCEHYQTFCTLGTAVAVTARKAVSQGLDIQEACGISQSCRWYAENGLDACYLCPHITRHPVVTSENYAEATFNV